MEYKKIIIRWGSFLFGLFCFSVAFSFFLLPNNLVFGGVSGLSIVFKELFNINTSLFVLLTSVGLLLISFPLLGREKTVGSIMGSLLLPLFLELTGRLAEIVEFENTDLMLASVFGGVIGGIGFGLVYKAGFTTGGTDIIKQLLNKYFKISMGKAMFIVESIIILCGTFVFGMTRSLYGLIVLFLITEITDRVILGISRSKSFYIVTDNTEEVKKFIIKKLGHSVTVFDAIGGFSKENQKVLFCVIPTREYYILKEGINKIDKDAFFVVCDAYEVHGGE